MSHVRLKFEGSSSSLIAFLHLDLLSHFSKKKIKAALEKKGCKVNGHLETFASRTLKNGDEIVFDMTKIESKKRATILFEDDHFIAIDKPPFMKVDAISIERELGSNLTIVHRLDKETSGLLLLSKSKETTAKFEELFFKRKIEKTYLALVKGKCEKKSGFIDEPIFIEKKTSGSKKMGIGPCGDEAYTGYEVVNEKGNFALIRCSPKSGRTHQIRVHLEAIDLHILGDHVYGSAKNSASRVMLHSQKLKFDHPITGEPIFIEAKIPADFLEAQKRVGL
ncbi:MAG: RluA family pseudouridine synthase [Rhabdochlamydiaceae bacterium]|nr:RluA family pseudouridine synthase [Candidatus Amphrikana amoebophyrae]